MSLKKYGDFSVTNTEGIKEDLLDVYKRQRTCLLIAVGCLGAISVGLFVGLLLAGTKIHLEEEAFCLSSACTISAAELLHAFNQSEDPCDDFYQFVCGNQELPEWSFNRNDQFLRVTLEINDKMRPLLMSIDPETVPVAVQKAIKLMKACTQFTNLTDQRNLKMLRDYVKEFGGWPLATPGEWDPRRDVPFHMLATTVLKLGWQLNLFTLSVSKDEKELDKYRITISQPYQITRGIISPPRQTAATLTGEQEKKAMNIHALAALLGNNDTKSIDTSIDEIFKLTDDLTKITVPRTETKNDISMYKKMTIRELQNITDNKIEWLMIIKEVFKDFQINDKEEIIVNEVEYIQRLPSIMAKYNPRVITNYILTHVLLTLKDEVDTESTTVDSRMPNCYMWVNEWMPLATGRLYVDTFFNHDNIEQVKILVDEIKDAYRVTIRETSLMDEETKTTALNKLDNMTEVIGYPDWILDDEMLNDAFDFMTVTDNHLQNIITIYRNGSEYYYKQLRDIPDNSSSECKPTEVNAYYDQNENKMVIEAGILHPPFFQADYTLAKNFGALGSVIGHEIGHGFDSTGRMHDEHGMLREWWSEESLNSFENKTHCFIDQYNEYCPTEYLTETDNGTCVDGNYTKTENMADNSGIRMAFKAFRMATYKKFGVRQLLPGLGEYTRDQVFFISYANMWCETIKKGAYKAVYGNDIHAVAKYRVIGSLSNFPEFAKIFKCSAGLMSREEESCSQWT